jgi:16S rRNA (adenine1518-N6/adenine1519-N6)-dimethyltransferase
VTESEDIDAARILKSHGIRPRHRLGQNFLQDQRALEHITAAAEIRPDDTVLEIGCGFGSLTRYLARSATAVVAVELDPKLAALAAELLNSLSNIRLICGDILTLAPGEIGLGPAYVAAANIPYYVTSPIMRHLLESDPKPRRIVLTVQQEVAERVCAVPPHMSMLSLSVQVYGSAEIVAAIPAIAFFPVPKVDSAVVRIEAYETPLIPPALVPVFFTLAKAGFMQRRKTLRNALAAGLSLSPVDAAGLLSAADIDPRRRAQTLGLAEWEALSREAARRLA